ncbi:DUF7716 domain-containing protein [Flavobacterium johnsoniae]|uniref:DUF7716 domain-containing protein n=1 Tax=Flavobacterium johnsoniae (strain ATCC 17061 / DSM 2064 / JCM 8514 / BCRC 14874 / CCUG 350202 / NBRC 14942 / NCIMB 11054 / UW101) TaxID=376686 RepID=A5FL13_FLAJ1|nr:hypothetical protein [Flavobacterium johnsoniae]ABQ04105.1 hypothetical protein Fjoh_1072 [Flavobacterium johnsoniae UW101]OXG02661.1 hypothetical protein B0A63_03120 [Flavobacterium johnsoniae UW101]WQG79024.1 hypothetical protein SR927_13440 [Flavobacterium johnsoniae UW101]SHK12493.1 hypothetical protein SAMN05444146_0486 [Flavobacterium johnsoniae]
MNLVSIRDILSYPEKNPGTWFYLPPNKEEWNLDTMGVFSLDSYDFPPDSKDYLPEEVEKYGWIEILDGVSIEDLVEYAKNQLENPSIDQLFNSFIFYYKNDAFLDF